MSGNHSFDPAALMDDVAVSLLSGDTVRAIKDVAKLLSNDSEGLLSDRVESLTSYLESDRESAKSLGAAIRSLVEDSVVGPALTQSGVATSVGFFHELRSRLVRRVVPALEDPKDIRTIVRSIFDRRGDADRIDTIPDGILVRLLNSLGFDGRIPEVVEPELIASIQTLAHHASSLGLSEELTSPLPHLKEPGSPFFALTGHVVDCIRPNEVGHTNNDRIDRARRTVGQCRAEVQYLRRNRDEYGTSLRMTGITFRLLQTLERLDILLGILDARYDRSLRGLAQLFKQIVRAEQTRNHILPHVRAGADLLAFQVVEHAARKGGKYITTGRRDYWSFFRASLGGGAIVAVFSFFKLLLADPGRPLGVQALLYGINYSACFVLIHLTGAALATKQPALTANTIAQALGNRQNRHLEELEVLVVRVWRSQFISFVGNLAMALPLAFVISEVYLRLSGGLIADPTKAESLLGALHPWKSGTVVFAAIAGFFLFAAGLISGWVDNRNIYANIPERIGRHPILAGFLGDRGSQSVVRFLEKHLGVIVGNVFLGFALGSTGTIGKILGLPLDIRHIAFASAEFGTALEVMNFNIAVELIWPVAIGVVLIGLVNFVTSFGLSFMTALESRQITAGEFRTLLSHLVSGFFRRPLDWFFPPKRLAHTPEDLAGQS